jgi:hypothetical protein
MELVNSRPDVVRSDTQNWLLSYWNGLRSAALLPAWPGLEVAELAAMSDVLSLADVVEVDGAVRFLIRCQGKGLSDALGAVSIGKFLDEVLPQPYRETALFTCKQVVLTGLPVYTIADLRDKDGRIVHFERLLLPFSHDGVTVHQVVASLEAVSPEGDFEQRGLMKPPAKPPAFAFCTTIQH